MANILNGFLNNVLQGATNPGGNLKGYDHAGRLFTDDAFRLAPKMKFLYHVVMELSEDAKKMVPQLSQKHTHEINMLVKAVDLPKYQVQTATKNMYNRKKNLQTSIEYDPINITFHDDNMGLTSTLMEAYYRYYYRDGNYGSEGASAPFASRNTYKDSITQNYRYGLDNDHRVPFFNKITIYQMARHQYLAFTLVNPLVTGLTHDQMDSSDGSTPLQNQITLAYEAVHYSRGAVGEDSPAGFATSHYDKTPSPLSIGGGGTSSLLGQGGVLGGISSVLGDLAGGTFNLGSAINVFNTYKNAKSLTKAGLRQEGFNILKSTLTNIGRENVSGIRNLSIPKQSVNASRITSTVGGTVNNASSVYAQRVQQALTANNLPSNSFSSAGPVGRSSSRTSSIAGSASSTTLQSQRNGPR